MVGYLIDFILIINLIAIVYIDIKKKIIPNYLNLSLFCIGILLGVLNGDIEQRVIGSGVYTLPFILIYAYGSDFFNKECIGMGDIKLVLSLGMILRFNGFYKVLLFINISFIGGLIYVLLLSIYKKRMIKKIAFAPFLILSSIILKVCELYG